MKIRQLSFFLIALMVSSVFVSINFSFEASAQTTPDLYFGVDIAYGGREETKQLIDQVSSFTNLIVIGQAKLVSVIDVDDLNYICQYAYDKGMYFMTYQLPLSGSDRYNWVKNTTQWWPNHYLGVYSYEDEKGGKQLDDTYNKISDLVNHRVNFGKSNDTELGAAYGNYNNSVGQLAAVRYESMLSSLISGEKAFGKPVFTSDYALYWFDYKAGFDTVFSEFVWNENRQLTVALSRGAATVQNKSSGVIIGWKYDPPQYLGTGTDLYNDLITAYDSGAQYIALFDSNKDYTAGILRPEHLQAMQQFWQHTQNNTRKTPPVTSRIAAILPSGYGCGFRSPTDSLWGLWCADSYTNTLYTNLGKLLQQYGNSLDIIYDDNLNGTYGYSQLINWTDPLLSTPPPPTPTPTPSRTPTLSPTPTTSPTPTLPPTPTPPLTSTPTQSPTSTLTPYPTPVPTPSPTSQPTESSFPSASPSSTEPLPTQTPNSKPAPFPSRVIYAATIAAAVAFTAGGAFFLKKRK